MLARRPATTLVKKRGISTVHDFVDHIDNDPPVVPPVVVPPVGDLVLGTHAGGKGFLTVRLSIGQARKKPSDFEAFHDSIGAGSNAIAIPDALLGFNPGDPVTHNFHIKGCNVGRDRTDASRSPPAAPFLVKIKEALGDHVNVTAPKHFHGLESDSGLGVFEYMAYEFKRGVTPTVISRRPKLRLRGYADKAAAVADFQAGKFEYIDTTPPTPVPPDDWDALIPADIRGQNIFAKLGIRDKEHRLPLGALVGTRRTLKAHRQFRVDIDDVMWPLTYPRASDIPADEPGRLAALRADIPRDARFDPTHPFPQFERSGFTSFDDFFAGYFWDFKVSGSNLVCTGTRFIYTVLLPIVDRATGNVFFNFYPNAGSAIPAITTGLRESDGRFFGRS